MIVPKFDPNNIDPKLMKKNEQKKVEPKKKVEITKGVDKKTLKIEKANKLLERVQ